MVMQRNVAWWATGKLYKHNEGVNTNFILDGASARTTLLSFDFSKILQPKILNGVMCIRQIINLNPWMYSYPGYHLPED
jgi:penicillin amidase